MKRILLVCFLALSVQTGAISQDQAVNTRNGKPARVQYGTASFYADKFEGQKTANGEIFTQKGMTAAHNSLPLGTWIRVTNLSNKKSVLVKVNDRLHHRNPRLVDLSKSAAKKLGYTDKGLSKVRVDVIGKNPNAVALK
jgi:rare lipoprotein A